ncbi:MAG: AIPR family protein, partial [Acidobacteria bacterium]|nr:AIPR family protein [Acidobacteriota bacterium]
TTAAEGDPIFLDVMIGEWGHMEIPFEAYYGQVNASDIAKWFDAHGDRLFSRNLRKLIQTSDVNKSIAESARQHPTQFWYLNNGITVLCDKLKKKPLGGADRTSGVFECEGFSVVNGAQTVGSVASAAKTSPAAVQQAKVLVRLISLENCPASFGEEVTRATNMQNRIENRDFVSLDQEQVRLRQEFVMDGKYYALKTGEPAPLPDQGLTIDEATVALACARAEVQHAVIAKAAVGRFWENLDKAPYRLLFNSSLTSLRLWRLVQILRSVEEALKTVPTNDSKTKAAAIHGNRFIAHEVFIRLPLATLDNPGADASSIVSAAAALVPKIHTATADALASKFAGSYPGSLFKNATKCASLSTEVKKNVPLA